jgi:hypothetical protein
MDTEIESAPPVSTPAEWARRLRVAPWKASAAIALRGWCPWEEITEADYTAAVEAVDAITMQ